MKYFVMALIVALALTSCGKGEQTVEITDTLRVATGPQGGTWASVGAFLEPTFAPAGYGVRILPGGGVSNILAVSAGEADMGLSLSFLGARAVNGDEPFDKPVGNVRSLGNLYPQYLYCLMNAAYARKHSIHTFRDMFGDQSLRLALLERGTASEALARKAIEACGETVAGVTMSGGVLFLDYTTAFHRLHNNEIDAFIFTLSAPSKPVYDASCMDELVILPMDIGLIRKLREELGTTSHTLPAGMYPSLKEDVRVVGDYTCLIVNEDMPDSMAAALTDALLDNWSGLEEIVPALPREEQQNIFSDGGFPLHNGVRKRTDLADTPD